MEESILLPHTLMVFLCLGWDSLIPKDIPWKTCPSANCWCSHALFPHTYPYFLSLSADANFKELFFFFNKMLKIVFQEDELGGSHLQQLSSSDWKMSSPALSYQKSEHAGRGCSCRTLNYFPSYLPGFNCAATVKLSLRNNRMCTASIWLLVSSVRRTRAPVNLPRAWGKVKEGGRHLGKILSLSLITLFTATWKKDPTACSWLGKLLLERKIVTVYEVPMTVYFSFMNKTVSQWLQLLG